VAESCPNEVPVPAYHVPAYPIPTWNSISRWLRDLSSLQQGNIAVAVR
jgi:hypothetical protein